MKRKWLGRSAVLVALVLLVSRRDGGGGRSQALIRSRCSRARRSRAADVGVSLNLLWVVIGAVLVIFMQAGFALVETGFTRAKHAAHVFSTNFTIFGLGFVGFFLVGLRVHVRRLQLPGPLRAGQAGR